MIVGVVLGQSVLLSKSSCATQGTGSGCLPGQQLIGFSYKDGIPLYGQVATVLAGLVFIVVGILAQELISAGRSERSRSRPVAASLTLFLTASASLVLAAYLYSEAGGTTNRVAQMMISQAAGSALTMGAVATFVAFNVLVAGSVEFLSFTAELIVSVTLILVTFVTFVSNSDVYEGLTDSAHGIQAHVQLGVLLIVLAVSAYLRFVRSRPLRPGKPLVAATVLPIAGIAVLGGASLSLFNGSNEHILHLALMVDDVWTWGRVGLWAIMVLALALWRRSETDGQVETSSAGPAGEPPPEPDVPPGQETRGEAVAARVLPFCHLGAVALLGVLLALVRKMLKGPRT